ncbi:MAG: (2Fe-2S)-binding protein [Gammaproteobacteria bacterium]|nr:(2Fe-2S)-binding protein [Gammaproteobacteria bacterium]
MFKRIQPIDQAIEIHFEDRLIRAQPGDSVAAALLAEGVKAFRQIERSNELRGPYCMIGNCFECLVEIDGRPNLQACQYRVRNGMKIRMQRGLRGGGSGDQS